MVPLSYHKNNNMEKGTNKIQNFLHKQYTATSKKGSIKGQLQALQQHSFLLSQCH